MATKLKQFFVTNEISGGDDVVVVMAANTKSAFTKARGHFYSEGDLEVKDLYSLLSRHYDGVTILEE